MNSLFFNLWISCSADFNAENTKIPRHSFLLVEAGLTQQAVLLGDFFHSTLKSDGKQALEPLDVPLGRMCWTSIYSDWLFFLSCSFPQEVRESAAVGETK